MMQLYALALSGYCAKVRIVLRLKNIAFEQVAPHGGHYSSAEYQRQMPPGSIPSIEHNGFKLFDSEAIVEYLEDLWQTPSMRAQDPQINARQSAITQFHNTRLEPAVRALFVHVKPSAAERDMDTIDNALAAFCRRQVAASCRLWFYRNLGTNSKGRRCRQGSDVCAEVCRIG